MTDRVVRPALLAAACFSLLVAVVHFARVGFGVYGDGMGYYAPLRSVVFDHDLVVTDEYRYFASFPGRYTAPPPTFSKFPVGMGIILAPAFLAGHALALALRAGGATIAADGRGWPYELCYCLGSTLIGVAGLLVIFRVAAARYGRGAALAATLGVWFASPLTYYLLVENSYAHAVSSGIASLVIAVVARRRWAASPGLQFGVGVLSGVLFLVRPQDIVFAAIPASMLLWGAEGSGRVARLASLALVAAGMALAALPQLAVNAAQNGSPLALPYFAEHGGDTFHWLWPRAAEVLVSPFHGLLAWHPLMTLAVIGLIPLVRDDRRMGGALLAVLAAETWIIGAWWCWWQGASLGGRMFSSAAPIFVLGLASLWNRLPARRWRAALAGLIGAAALWNTLLIVQYLLGIIPAEAPVGFRTIAANQLKVISVLASRLLGG